MKEKYNQKKSQKQEDSKPEDRIKDFRAECRYGPIFTCICCMRDMFQRGVKKITPVYEAFLRGNDVIKYLQTEEFTSSGKSNGKAKKLRLKMTIGSKMTCLVIQI